MLGWHATANIPAQFVISSLRQAYRSRRFPLLGLIVYTDLNLRHAIPSMSRKGNCYDNSAMVAKPRSESFWATLST